MSELTPAQRAERRAQAMARLEQAKQHMAAKAAGNAPAASAPAASAPAASAPAARGQAQPKTVGPQARNAAAVQQSQRKSGLFAKPYIEYDFSTMEDSKGGFMVEETAPEDPGAKHAEWLESLSNQQPPFDFSDPRAPACFECGTKELDFRLWRVFATRVCKDCRRAKPEKYSLLTKTECKQDYLLTESELRDTDLLPHLERPNPYQQTYSNMMLYLRYQVEEFAWKKWGGPEQLDAEYERREGMKKQRQRAKFEAKLKDMRNKTRAQAITKSSRHDKHTHIWGPPQKQGDGTSRRVCGGCGMNRTEMIL